MQNDNFSKRNAITVNNLTLIIILTIILAAVSGCHFLFDTDQDNSTTPTTNPIPTTISPGTETTVTSGPMSFDLRYVPAGSFVMGSSNENADALFEHQVTLTKSFWMGETEVTYALWTNVTQWAGTNGYIFSNPGLMGDEGDGTDTSQDPVTTANWRDCMVWCNALSQKLGLTPAYTYGGKVITNSMDSNQLATSNAVFDYTANGYRLPTEAEWEYAARYKDGVNWQPGNYHSGATNDYNNVAACTNVAWYSGSDTQPVGQLGANALGLLDMSGNVHEWCWDWYDSGYYASSPSTDPTGAATGTAYYRVCRGGSWSSSASFTRITRRQRDFPRYEGATIGLRLVRNE